MPQTLLALIAIVIATTFAITQTRAITHQDMQMVGLEVQTQATGVAAEWLDEAAARALVGGFDEATGPVVTAADLVPVAGLTPDSLFGPETLDGGEFTTQGFDDVDDYHGLCATVLRAMATPDGGGDAALTYRVRGRVQYVTDADPSGTPLGYLTPSPHPTYQKLVEITVDQVPDGVSDPCGAERAPADLPSLAPPVTLSRVFTYPN